MQIKNMTNASDHSGANVVNFDEPNNLVDLLNDLMVTNRGMINVYHTAVEQIDNETNVVLLHRFAATHETMLAELSNLVVKHQGAPAANADTSSLLKRAWVSIKATFTEGDGPILDEIAQDSKTVLEAYGEVMGNPSLPEDVREVIRKQMSEVRVIHKKLSALSAAFA